MSMGKAVFSNEISGGCDPLFGYAKDEAIPASKEDQWFDIDDSGFMDLLSSVFGQENTLEKKAQVLGNYEQQTVSDDWMQHGFCEGIVVDQGIKEIIPPSISGLDKPKPVKEKPDSFSLATWELLSKYSRGFKTSRDENPSDHLIDEIDVDAQKLSTAEILRIAGEKFIQFSTNRVDGISISIHPYGYSLSGLSIDGARDVELVNLLFAAAESVGKLHFDVASKLIYRCQWVASDSGTPVQRVSFYFAEALLQRINRESGRIPSEKKRQPEKHMKGLALGTNNAFLASHQELPFAQVMQFAGIQTIIDNVKTTSGKIHLIDLQIRSGIQWTALMQGLAEFHIQHIKITAVITCDQENVEETGKRLQTFAQSLNLPFSFKVVYLTDMSKFKEDLISIETDETVAVYSFVMLRTMISRPDCLENLMRAITRLRPALMVVVEVEANHNSSSFIDRFIEALFFYSTYFDCLEDCMDRNNQFRMIIERSYFGEGIANIVAMEGEERVTRNVKIDVWRAFLVRFGMMEIELSESSRYQASLVLKQFARGSSCTLDYNDKCLLVGWKGTPLHSLTAWKFS